MVSPTANLRGVAVLPPSDDLSILWASSLTFPTALLPKTDKSLDSGILDCYLLEGIGIFFWQMWGLAHHPCNPSLHPP